MRKAIIGAVLATALAVPLAGTAFAGPGRDTVTVCHVPPGNPDKAHEITVSARAAQAHLEEHPEDLAAPCGAVSVTSAVLNFSGTGWGGWSCPAGYGIYDATVQKAGGGEPDYPIGSITLWEPGATAGGATYPNTPFGYTYTPPEEGAIVQNGGTGQSLEIVLTCVPQS